MRTARADGAPRWERGMNEEQLAVIRHEGGPLRVLAAAGSGKTRALVHRVVRLVELLGVDPQRILCVTFSVKGAGEMDARLRKLGCPVTVKTWHGFCNSVIRAGGLRESAWQVDDKEREKVFVKTAAGYKGENWVRADITKIRTFIGRCKANLWAPDFGGAGLLAHDMFSFEGPKAVRVYARTQGMLEEAGLFTFDDMLCIVARHLQEDEGARLKWAARFDYLMTDECQDNNPAQETLTELLGRDHRNVMVVGDLCQSLYSFRGAEPSLLDGFAEKWGAPTVTMHRNYRSGPAIVGFANDVIREGKYKLPRDMEAARDSQAPGEVVVHRACDLEDEAGEMVEAVKSHLAAGGKLSDWYVLFRLNAQSRALEEALLRERIPYVIVGGTSFYERKEIKDLLAYLRVALGRDRTGDAVRRCINAPFRFLGAAFVAKVGEELDAGAAPLVAVDRAALTAGIQRRQVESALEWARLVRGLGAMAGEVDADGKPQHSAADLLEDLVRTTGYISWLEKEEGAESVESSHAANVRELLRVAREFATAGALLDYVEKTVAEGAKQRKQKTGDLLTLMSIHRSKGLEKPVVWLVGCNEDVLPHAKGDLEEERRIMYVGITRAQDTLHVSYVCEMAMRAGLRDMAPSRFLAPVLGRASESRDSLPVTEASVVEAAREVKVANLFPSRAWMGEGAKCLECGQPALTCKCGEEEEAAANG